MDEWRFEIAALVVVLVGALIAPRWGQDLHDRLIAGCERLGRRPARWILTCGLVAGLGAALTASLTLWPEPGVHDEFSYLLAAKTFASGNLSMPPHEMWEHFESIHILQQPGYASKFPPAQAITLALGLALTGSAVPGLWLQAAAMCSAIAWMLFGWLPRRWAVLGSVLVLLRLGIAGDWVQSFWGGAVAATGGALVFGALPRILHGPHTRHACILALGLAVLANSRPYEGLLASIPVAVVLAWWMIRNRKNTELRLGRRLILPILTILTLVATLMAYYNWRVTGDPMVLPYSAYDHQYAVYPPFLWQQRSPGPEYRHDLIRAFSVGFQAGDYEVERGLLSLASLACQRAWEIIRFYFGLGLLIPMVMLPAILGLPQVVFALATSGLLLTGLAVTTYCQPHYAAPITCLLVFLIAAGWRRMARLDRNGASGAQAVLATVALVTPLLTLSQIMAEPSKQAQFGQLRASMQMTLLNKPGRDLVIVRNSLVHFVWVYNEPRIDEAEIVWARDMGQDKNRRLLRYFHDREPWQLDMGPDGPELEPYDRSR